MKDYSQNGEQKFILDYFGDFKGFLLDIGANDGETLSNTRALMLNGWKGMFVEPAPIAFSKVEKLYGDMAFNIAIANENKTAKFFDSGTHLDQGDTSLISTLNEAELERWKGSKFDNFKEIEVNCCTFEIFKLSMPPNVSYFDFINIDAEGLDLDILKQIDLSETKCVCIEYNAKEEVAKEIQEYCGRFGLNVTILKNYENLIIARI